MKTSRRLALITPFLAVLASAAALTLTLLPATAQAAEQGSGRPATEVRSVGEFRGVATSGNVDVVVRQGAASVQVQADDNLLPLLETVVERGVLQVRWQRGSSVRGRSKALVTVSAPQLDSLSSAGAGNVRLEAFKTPALKLSLSGAGDARLDGLQTDELALSIAGSSNVSGAGRAARLKVSIAGSGDVRLSELRADDVSVRIAGNGDAAVHADKSLAINIAGSGDVHYSGQAAVTRSVVGSGSVHKR